MIMKAFSKINLFNKLHKIPLDTHWIKCILSVLEK